MIDVTNQKFIICQNPNLEPGLRKYLVSYNGIDVPDEDYFDLRDPKDAYKFGVYSAAYTALKEIKKLGYHNAEILILETTVHVEARKPSNEELVQALYDSALSKLTSEEYEAVANRVMIQYEQEIKMEEQL